MPSIAASAFASLGAAFVIQLALLVSGIISARILGPEGRGMVAIFALMVGVPTQLSLLGINVGLAYFLAKHRRGAPALLKELRPTITVQLVVSVVVPLFVTLFWLDLRSSELQWAALAFVAGGPAIILQQYGFGVLQGMQQFKIFNTAQFLPAGLNAVLLALAAAVGSRDVLSVSVVWLGATWASSLAITRLATKSVGRMDAEPSGVTQCEMVRFGAKSFLGSATPLETFRLDQMIVSLFLTPAALGIYVAALAFTNLPRFVSQSFGRVAYPYIASRATHGEAKWVMWRFFAASTVTSAVVTLGLILVAGQLLPLFFGDDFRAAVTPMRILLIAAFVQSARGILSDGLRGLGYPVTGSAVEGVTWIVLVPLLTLLAPRWQLNGVAASITIASMVGLVMILIVAGSAHDSSGRNPPDESVIDY